MKRILSFVLVLVMSLGLLAGCGEPVPTTTAKGSGLEDAAAYLHAMYKANDGTACFNDWIIVSVVAIDGVTYPVSWKLEVTAGDAEAVTMKDNGNKTFTVSVVNKQPAEQVDFTLTATVSDASGATKTVTFKRYIKAVEQAAGETTVTMVTAPEVGKAYKLGMLQGNLSQNLYITGNTANKDYYLETVEAIEDGMDVYLEAAEGGYYVYFTKDGVKTYIDIYANDGGYVNIRLTDAPSAVFVWNTEYNTLTTSVTVGETTEDYYMGTYKEYNTVSASKLSYAATSFPANLWAVEQKAVKVEAVTTPVAGTAYKMGMLQGNLSQSLYITGNTANKDYYLETTEVVADAIDVYLEETEGGFYIYFTKDGVKTYIDIYANDGGYVNIRLTDAPSAVFVWNTEYNTLTTSVTVGETTEDYYMGTYKEYNTVSASKLSYAATSFPATLYTVG